MLTVAAWLSPLDRDQYGSSYPQAASADTQEGTQHAAPEHQVSDDGPSLSDFVASWLTYLQSAPDSTKDTQDDRENTRQDLQAQKAMALWAFWMFISSSLSVLVAVVAVVLVYLTLREAKETTRAAVESVAVSRHTLEATSRPWLSIRASIVDDLTWNKNHAGTTVRFSYRNFGNAPAINAHVRHQIGFHCLSMNDPTEDQRMFSENIRENPHLIATENVFPGEEMHIDIGMGISPRQVEELTRFFISENTKPEHQFFSFILSGCVQYWTTNYGRPKHCGFIYEFLGPNEAGYLAPFVFRVDKNFKADQLTLRAYPFGSGIID